MSAELFQKPEFQAAKASLDQALSEGLFEKLDDKKLADLISIYSAAIQLYLLEQIFRAIKEVPDREREALDYKYTKSQLIQIEILKNKYLEILSANYTHPQIKKLVIDSKLLDVRETLDGIPVDTVSYSPARKSAIEIYSNANDRETTLAQINKIGFDSDEEEGFISETRKKFPAPAKPVNPVRLRKKQEKREKRKKTGIMFGLSVATFIGVSVGLFFLVGPLSFALGAVAAFTVGYSYHMGSDWYNEWRQEKAYQQKPSGSKKFIKKADSPVQVQQRLSDSQSFETASSASPRSSDNSPESSRGEEVSVQTVSNVREENQAHRPKGSPRKA